MSEVKAVDFPTFQRWSNSFVPPIRPSGYLEHKTSLLSTMLLVELIFPALVEVRGCVLRADAYDKANLDRWWAALDGDPEQVERVVIALPMRYLFDPADEVEERALGVLAERIARGWRAEAALRFPDRPIAVEVVEGTEDDGPTVLLYRRRFTPSAGERWVPRVREFARHRDRETGETYVRPGILRPADPDEIAPEVNGVRAVDFPAFRSWSARFSPEMPPVAHLQLETTLLSAMLVSELLFPRLIEVRGCVVRADKYDEDNFNDWWEHLAGDREQVERIINFQPTMFHFYPEDEVEEKALEVLADRMARGWRIEAARQFPDRTLVVEIRDGKEDHGPTVVLYTHRPPGP